MTEGKRNGAKRVRLGRQRFATISAVEGLSLTFAASAEFDEDDQHGLTADQRRQRIIEKYTGRRS